MALFADGPSPTIDDLTDQDCGLLEVARDCGINLTTKLLLAHDDLCIELQSWLDRSRAAGDLTSDAWPTLAHIVVSKPLVRWETYQTIVLVYRDAFFGQLVDRYQGKWQEFVKLARDARERFLASGMPLVNHPAPQAMPPALATVAGPQNGGTFYASISWINAFGQEGAASVPSSLIVKDGRLMTVSGVSVPKSAIGFNVYAGDQLDGLHLQNDTPLPIGSRFTYVPGARVDTALPGDGQKPDVIRPMRRTLLRG